MKVNDKVQQWMRAWTWINGNIGNDKNDKEERQNGTRSNRCLREERHCMLPLIGERPTFKMIWILRLTIESLWEEEGEDLEET